MLFNVRAYAVVVGRLTESAESFYQKFGLQVLREHNGRVCMIFTHEDIGAVV